MLNRDLDTLHKSRLEQFGKKLPRRRDRLLSGIFLGERVLQTIDKPKIMIHGFRLDTILPLLPFSPIAYVSVCPHCVGSDEQIDQCLELVRAGLILPVLCGEYSSFPDRIVRELRTKDHISTHEAAYFYDAQLWKISGGRRICDHCYDGRTSSVIERAKSIESARAKRAIKVLVELTAKNLSPPIFPDYEILDAIEEAISEHDGARIVQLSKLSAVIKQVRDAQIWNSALPVSASDLKGVPPHISAEMDEGRLVSIGLHQFIAEGLALKIPMVIPLPQYAEIVREFQPRISAVVSRVVDKAGKRGLGLEAMSREISRLNNEIGRIKNLKRHLVVEALAEPIRKNKALVTATLVAGALGLSGSLVACGSALAVGGAMRAAKRYNIGAKLLSSFKDNEPLAKLGTKIREDIIQPQVDKVMARYLQTDLPAITVLAVKRDLERLN